MLTLRLLHLFAFVYWLGSDIGVYYTSSYVSNPGLTAAQRSTAVRILLGIDMIPRCCMPLTLATGMHLAILSGALPLPGFVAPLGWCLCLAWLAMVNYIHHAGAKAPGVARIDSGWRVIVTLALGSVAAAGLLRMWPTVALWLALKLLCYAGCVACGLMIRVQLRSFGAAMARLLAGSAGADEDALIAGSLRRCKPYVIAIWILLAISAVTGLHWLTP